MPSKRCYYEVLGVARDAETIIIRKAYERISFENHPDRNGDDPDAAARWKEADEAYKVLSDPEKRRVYDRYGHAGLEAGPAILTSGGMGGTFADFFFRNMTGQRGPRRGQDIHEPLTISLLDAYRGGRLRATIQRRHGCETCKGAGHKPGAKATRCRRCHGRGAVVQNLLIIQVPMECPDCGGAGEVVNDPCTDCGGAGQVEREATVEFTIPPGTPDNYQLTLPAQGDEGEPGGLPGDLVFVFRIAPSDLFVRRDLDVHCAVPVTVAQAALGGEVEVPTLDGGFHKITLPPGSQTGDKIPLTGLGMPSLRGRRRGDLVVHLRVVTPRNLSKREEELLRELAELEKDHIPQERRAFLGKVEAFFQGNESES